MTLNEYQAQAMSFRLPDADDIYALINLSAEVGELHGHIAKAMRDGGVINSQTVLKELGDILWHVAAIAEDCNFTLAEVAEGNLSKLTGRLHRGTLQGSGDER